MPRCPWRLYGARLAGNQRCRRPVPAGTVTALIVPSTRVDDDQVGTCIAGLRVEPVGGHPIFAEPEVADDVRVDNKDLVTRRHLRDIAARNAARSSSVSSVSTNSSGPGAVVTP